MGLSGCVSSQYYVQKTARATAEISTLLSMTTVTLCKWSRMMFSWWRTCWSQEEGSGTTKTMSLGCQGISFLWNHMLDMCEKTLVHERVKDVLRKDSLILYRLYSLNWVTEIIQCNHQIVYFKLEVYYYYSSHLFHEKKILKEVGYFREISIDLSNQFLFSNCLI